MSGPSRTIRGAGRAVTGLVVIAAAAGGLMFVQTTGLPGFERTPPAATVDTLRNSTQQLVCAGGFSVLGADPSRPEVAIPTGAATLTVVGDDEEISTLTRSEGEEGAPAVISAPAGSAVAAAQLQQVSTDAAEGAVASSCSQPLNEQWLLGGDTTDGVTTTLTLGNAASVPATVRVTVYDESGKVAAAQTSSVLVQPRSEQIVSLNGYAPGRASLAAHVVSTGAPVTAGLSVTQQLVLDPFGVSDVSRQVAPREQLVIPGITTLDRTSDKGPNDVGTDDPFGVRVRVLAPSGELGKVEVKALTKNGEDLLLGDMQIVGEGIAEMVISEWPEGANGLLIDSEVPVIAGALGTIDTDDGHDISWFVPAPEIGAGEVTPAPVVDGGELFIANPGENEAEVEIAGGSGEPKTVTIAAGSVVAVPAGGAATIESNEPVYAAVRVVSGSEIASYPIQSLGERNGALTVYVR